MEEKKKTGFFKKLYISIVKLEDYTVFFDEPLYKTILYFITVCFLSALILGIGCSSFANKAFYRGFSYIKNSVPNFTVEDGLIKEDIVEYGYDKKYDLYFRLDSTDDLDYSNAMNVATKEYGSLFTDSKNFVLLYKSKAIIKYKDEHIEINYNDLLERLNVQTISKEELVSSIDENKGFSFVFLSISIMLMLGIGRIFIEIENVLILTIFTILTAMIVTRLRITLKTAFQIVCHTETLPILIYDFFLIYYIQPNINSLPNSFFIAAIGYIYIVAVLSIIKADLVEAYQVAVTMEKNRIKSEDIIVDEEEQIEDVEKKEELDDNKEELEEKTETENEVETENETVDNNEEKIENENLEENEDIDKKQKENDEVNEDKENKDNKDEETKKD